MLQHSLPPLNIAVKTAGNSHSPALLLLHGFAGRAQDWSVLVEHLQSDFFVIVPDLPGHGQSLAVDDPFDMSLEAIADALVHLLSALKVAKCSILGYSMGGRVALTLAVRHPHVVNTLVLESTTAGIIDDDARQKRRAQDLLLAKTIEQHGIEWFVNYWESLDLFKSQKDLPLTVQQSIRASRLAQLPHGLSQSLRASGAGIYRPLWGFLKDIRIPSLIVVGQHDIKYSQIGKQLAAALPTAHLQTIPAAAHNTHVENPQVFLVQIRRFLQNHRGESI